MTKKYIIYRHIRNDLNVPFYIGKAIKHKGRYDRAFDKKNRSRFWKNIVNNTTYSIDFIFESDDHEEIIKKEIEFIALYGRRNLGRGTLVNLTDGGEGSVGAKYSQKVIQQRVNTRRNSDNYGSGKRLNVEHKNKIKDSMPNKKAIRCVETGEEFESVRDAARAIGCPSPAIFRILSGTKKRTRGLSFERI